MDILTIKLLHERRSNSRRRKVEGRSGMTYPFIWSDEHKHYIYTTANQQEADDLFNAQGRVMGCYFAPVLVTKKPDLTLSDGTMLGMLERELVMPENFDAEAVALALLAAHDRGRVAGASDAEKKLDEAKAHAAITVVQAEPTPAAEPIDTVAQVAASEAEPVATVAATDSAPAEAPSSVAATELPAKPKPAKKKAEKQAPAQP